MFTQLKAAVIGCGSIGEIHTQCLSQLDGMNMVAYCDAFIEQAKKLYQKYGGEYFTDNLDRVLKDDSIDVVYICTYHDTHASFAIKACEAGKHIMMEKPLALTVAECYNIGEAIEKSGVKLMTGFKMRYYPMIARAKQFLPKPLVTVGQMMDGRWPNDMWANDPIKGGGNVLSQGCHTMDIVYYLNESEPIRIYAEGGNLHHPGLNIIDNVAATIQFANGSIATITQGDSGQTPFSSKFFFQMMDGTKTVQMYDRLKTATFFDGEKATVHNDPDEFGFLEENRDFVRALQNGTPPPITHRDGLRATLLVLKAFEAVRTHQPQEIQF
jgi:predicted dehydrogenase